MEINFEEKIYSTSSIDHDTDAVYKHLRRLDPNDEMAVRDALKSLGIGNTMPREREDYSFLW